MTRAWPFHAALLLLSLIGGCAPPADQLQRTASKRETVAELAERHWQASLRASPRDATAMGISDYDFLLESVAPGALTAQRDGQRALLDKLSALPIAALSDAERLHRDLLAQELLQTLALGECRYHEWHVDHMEGLGPSLSALAQRHPVKTTVGATALISRYLAVPRLVAEHVANLRRGLFLDETTPRVLVERALAQLDALLADAATFLPPREGFAADADATVGAALWDELVYAEAHALRPALLHYRNVLAGEVLPEARTGVGLWALPFGASCYAAEIARHTGSTLSAHALHQLGLREVERIMTELEGIAARIEARWRADYSQAKAQADKRKAPLDPRWAALFPAGAAPGAAPGAVRGKPTLRAFIERLRLDPTQQAPSREALLEGSRAIVARAQAALPRAFGQLPRTPVEVKPIEAFRERESPAAYYENAPVDGSRPAAFYLNTFEPRSRPLYNQEALAFHEAVPGHHLQRALAAENSGLPAFLKHSGNTAFVEGWALYAERLAQELGLYSSDAAQVGRLGYELWRASRLVIDTGLHALGWSREQAVAFLLEHSTLPEVEARNEVDRYINWPGQALAYKFGELELRRLRASAEQRLGARFVLSAFHDELLGGGALPLPFIAQRIERWIEEQLAPPPQPSSEPVSAPVSAPR